MPFVHCSRMSGVSAECDASFNWLSLREVVGRKGESQARGREGRREGREYRPNRGRKVGE